ncbi:MAG: exodeoxyribonuclease VII large subunit [Rickettsiales bacterium]|jgi:exodeoxyribonuclease VII large subunit|nr:exodeoxyribonuclease VII large subunit [Rickettsiales bacterium]
MENILIPGYGVGELVKNIKTVLEGAFSCLKITGEISDFKKSPAGHYYFNLKEDDAAINAVFFKNSILNANLVLQNGLEVVCYGRLTTYAPKSNYQIIGESIRISGEGKLQKIIEERKEKLRREGLFDRKRKLPKIFRKIGLITSPSGAAIKDIEIKLRERLPVEVLLFPSLVQGNEAEKSLAGGIDFFNRNYPDMDALVITRGGGSAEDLMCFNGELLARAIFNSKIPIISAVGHEIDWSIADLAADLRLPTPTAAGEFLSPLKIEGEKRLKFIYGRIVKSVFTLQERRKKRLDSIFGRIVFALAAVFHKKAGALGQIGRNLEKFNRKKILKLGYAIVEKDGKIIAPNCAISKGDELTLALYGGKLRVAALEDFDGAKN